MTIDQAKAFKLSLNFTLYEFLYSENAVKYGLIDEQLNIPEKYILNLKRLCENVLQPLRNELKCSIRINSGYRCDKLNDAILGSNTSEHLEGKAADIYIPGKMDIAFGIIKAKCKYNQLINEQNLAWIHVSYDEFNNKGQVLAL